mgnify:CR=1 FL=1
MSPHRRSPTLPAGDALLWLVGAASGAALIAIPELVAPLQTEMTKLLLRYGAFFVLGGLLGLLAPGRPWRWAIASILLVPFAEWMVRLPAGETVHYRDLIGVLWLTRRQLEDYFLFSLVTLLGAVVGGAAATGR